MVDISRTCILVSYNKTLWHGPKSKKMMKPVTRITGDAQTLYYSYTRIYDRGHRLCPTVLYLDLRGKIMELKMKFMEAVGRLPEEIRSKCSFSFTSEILSPLTGFILEGMDLSRQDDLHHEVEATRQERLKEGDLEIVERIRAAMNRIVDRLDRKQEKIFRDSITENVRELCYILPCLNVRDDAFISRAIQKMKQNISPISADELRDSQVIKNRVRARAKEILWDLNKYS